MGTREYLDLVQRYKLRSENKNLLELAITKNKEELGRDAAGLLLSLGGAPMVSKVLAAKDTSRSVAMLNAMGGVGSKMSIDMIQQFALSGSNPMYMRKIAATKIGRSWEWGRKSIGIIKK
jgi:hypothetical protein